MARDREGDGRAMGERHVIDMSMCEEGVVAYGGEVEVVKVTSQVPRSVCAGRRESEAWGECEVMEEAMESGARDDRRWVLGRHSSTQR